MAKQAPVRLRQPEAPRARKLSLAEIVGLRAADTAWGQAKGTFEQATRERDAVYGSIGLDPSKAYTLSEDGTITEVEATPGTEA